MVIYVVQAYDDLEYGGYSEPSVEGVFSTRPDAERLAASIRRTNRYGYQEYARVEQLALDHPEVEENRSGALGWPWGCH